MKKTITTLLYTFGFLLSFNMANAGVASLMAPPVNDDCSNATTLTVNADYSCSIFSSGTVSEATASSQASECTGTSVKDDDDVWFKFVATASTHRITLKNIVGDFTNMFHAIYEGGVTGDCNALSILTCSDPDISNPSGLTVGNTYYIRVFTNSTANNHNTTFDICVGTAPAVPSNDDCSNAEVVSTIPFSINADVTGATNNGGFVNPSGCGAMNDGVWYEIVGDGTQITVYVLPTAWDVEIGVYTGSCGNFTCVTSVNTGISGTAEQVSFVSQLGTTYYVNVGHASDNVDNPEGPFTMNITSTTLSIEELLQKGFVYYPNPVDATLRLEANEQIKHIALYNAFGQQLRLVSPSQLKTSIDLSNFPTGAYFIRAYVGDGVGVFKVIKR